MLEQPSPKQIRQEKENAKKLKKTQWWQAKLNSGTCHYCGKKSDRRKLTMDHIVPLSRGGKSAKGNVAVCCKDCNNSKKYYTPAEIILQNKFNKEIVF